jgi:hypothetical protein
MHPQYAFVAAHAEFHCEYCRAPEEMFNMEFEVDHIFPRSRGGGDTLDNLALCCRHCNSRKRKYIEFIDPETKKTERLFNPFSDKWNEHFRFDPETNFIIGTSPEGRATVNCLKMNRHTQVKVRPKWIKANSFP